MSPLANAMYKILLKRLTKGIPSITYGELSEALPAAHTTHQRSRRLHTTLGEISVECRKNRLPCLPAMVWRADIDRPGPTYYEYAHPDDRTLSEQKQAWEKEHAKVLRAADKYPSAPW